MTLAAASRSASDGSPSDSKTRLKGLAGLPNSIDGIVEKICVGIVDGAGVGPRGVGTGVGPCGVGN